MEVPQRSLLGSPIARRAVDLALDGAVSLDDGSEHLRRLSGGRRAPLEDALGELPVAPEASPEEECARLLLHRAVAGLSVPAAVRSPT